MFEAFTSTCPPPITLVLVDYYFIQNMFRVLPPVAPHPRGPPPTTLPTPYRASSTMGMKKSVVSTSACASFSLYTAASSLVEAPTNSSGRPDSEGALDVACRHGVP